MYYDQLGTTGFFPGWQHNQDRKCSQRCSRRRRVHTRLKRAPTNLFPVQPGFAAHAICSWRASSASCGADPGDARAIGMALRVFAVLVASAAAQTQTSTQSQSQVPTPLPTQTVSSGPCIVTAAGPVNIEGAPASVTQLWGPRGVTPDGLGVRLYDTHTLP